ncbi:MAG: hypothetical protein WBM36_09060, partial [Lysobacterales bacterium]
SMVGMSLGSSRLKKFEDAVNKGEFLLLIDVARPRVEEIEEIVKDHYPEADIEGTEPLVPPFP